MVISAGDDSAQIKGLSCEVWLVLEPFDASWFTNTSTGLHDHLALQRGLLLPAKDRSNCTELIMYFLYLIPLPWSRITCWPQHKAVLMYSWVGPYPVLFKEAKPIQPAEHEAEPIHVRSRSQHLKKPSNAMSIVLHQKLQNENGMHSILYKGLSHTRFYFCFFALVGMANLGFVAL